MADTQVDPSSNMMMMMNAGMPVGTMNGNIMGMTEQNEAAAIAAAAAQTYLSPYAASFGGNLYNMPLTGGAGNGVVDIAQLQAQAIANQQMMYGNLYPVQPCLQSGGAPMYGGIGNAGMMMGMNGGCGNGMLPMTASFYGGGGMPQMFAPPAVSFSPPGGFYDSNLQNDALHDNSTCVLPLSNISNNPGNSSSQAKSGKRKTKDKKQWMCC